MIKLFRIELFKIFKPILQYNKLASSSIKKFEGNDTEESEKSNSKESEESNIKKLEGILNKMKY